MPGADPRLQHCPICAGGSARPTVYCFFLRSTLKACATEIVGAAHSARVCVHRGGRVSSPIAGLARRLADKRVVSVSACWRLLSMRPYAACATLRLIVVGRPPWFPQCPALSLVLSADREATSERRPLLVASPKATTERELHASSRIPQRGVSEGFSASRFLGETHAAGTPLLFLSCQAKHCSVAPLTCCMNLSLKSWLVSTGSQ